MSKINICLNILISLMIIVKKMFRRFGPRPFGPPIMPLKVSMFKEMKDLIFLWVIEEGEGITGYKIENIFNIPHSNVISVLKKLKEKKFVETSETIVNGRAQKYYTITEEGKEYLRKLRENWAERVSFLNDIVPPEDFFFGIHQIDESISALMNEPILPPKGRRIQHLLDSHPHIKRLKYRFRRSWKEFQTKEEIFNFLNFQKDQLMRSKRRMYDGIAFIEKTDANIGQLIEEVEKMEKYSPEELEKLIKKYYRGEK